MTGIWSIGETILKPEEKTLGENLSQYRKDLPGIEFGSLQ
jgi:hypothetical protein